MGPNQGEISILLAFQQRMTTELTELYEQAFKRHSCFRVVARAAALMLTGTFSLLTAFVLDFMGLTLRAPDELAGYLATPVLAAQPQGRG